MVFETVVSDNPGEMVKLLSLISRSHANIISITHDRSQHGISIGFTAVGLELETANEKHVEYLVEMLKENGYPVQLK